MALFTLQSGIPIPAKKTKVLSQHRGRALFWVGAGEFGAVHNDDDGSVTQIGPAW